MVIPSIHIERIHGYYNVFIDGKKIECYCSSSKRYWTRYLKKRFGIDLRTDPRISKNYKEFETHLIQKNDGKAIYVKSILKPIMPKLDNDFCHGK